MQRFFVSGYPKSGTTYLQMLLDAHPAINCPSEQSLVHLAKPLTRLARAYQATIEGMDRRTGGQGVRFDSRGFVVATLRAAIVHLMESGAGDGTTHCGINDNTMALNGETIAELMPRARFVFIVRDPREIALSLWHHKRRTEPGFAEAGTTIEETSAFVARTWSSQIGQFDDFRRRWPRRSHLVRYEDLRGTDRDRHLEAVLAFLGASAAGATLAAMWQATDFATLRQRERERDGPGAGFFRSGRTESWRTELSPAGREAIDGGAAEAMALIGYKPGA